MATNDYFAKTLLRDKDGNEKGLAIPYYNPTAGTIVYYIYNTDTSTESLYFDIDLESYYTKIKNVEFKVSIIEKPEYVITYSNMVDITPSAETEVVLKAGYASSDFLTISFKASQTKRMQIVTVSSDDNNFISGDGYYYYRLENGTLGNGGLYLPTADNAFEANSVNYVVLNLNKTSINKDSEVFKASKADITPISVGKYSFDSTKAWWENYRAESDKGYCGEDFFFKEEGTAFRNGTFTCDKYSSLSIKNGSFYYGKNQMSNTGFFNNGVDGRYRISGYNKEDSSILYIFDIDAFIYTSETEKSITGTVYLMKGKEVTATYKDVTFAYNAKSFTSN